jgi:Flp pilus assembly protein CpaB
VQYTVPNKLLSTRGGTIAVGTGAAVLGALILLVFLNRYRASLDEAATPMPVLVAKSLIQQGTSGDVIGRKDLFQVANVPKSSLKDGAIVDPSSIRGRTATDDIYPGQQLTAAEFTSTPTDSITNKLADFERAISLPLDSAHGMIGDIHTGDEVEILGGFQVQRIDRLGNPINGAAARPLLRVLVPSALVLQAPDAGGGAIGSSQDNTVVVKVTDRKAAELAFAAEYGKLWIVARPKTGARTAPRDVVSLETILLGVRPIQVKQSFGGR